MVLVLYSTPNPIIDERLENKILPLIDAAIEKTGIEAYALIHEDHVSVIIEPEDNTPEIEAMMKFVQALEENPDYEKYKELITITS